MYQRLLVFSSKLLIKLLRTVGKNGSALPGLIIERLSPRFLDHTLKSVENRIILVTGTNGKTTTTKMLVAGLRGAGARVVTNGTGSNMTRGLIAAVVEDMTYFGALKPTDWFVFEMDEAYAPLFTENISPKLVVGLNVLRDQLDRYGEIDTTAQMIGRAADKAEYFVYNSLDPLLTKVARELPDTTITFGIDKKLAQHVSNEQTLHGSKISSVLKLADVVLVSSATVDSGQRVKINAPKINHTYELEIPVQGFHNALNATAVAAVLTKLVNEDDVPTALRAISTMPAPFGRGEQLILRGKHITVALVKNPSGFTSNLETFVKNKYPEVILFVVNDKFADGRDVSWLWDVNFKPYISSSSRLYASGIRGYDMGLRLKHDNFDVEISTNISEVINQIMLNKHKNILIIPTYTALFEVRDGLSRYGEVPRIW